MHFFLQNSKGFPKCFHTTMLCLSHVYYSRQEPFPLPCVNAGSPTSNLYFWQSSPVPLSSETIQRSYFHMSKRTQDPKAQDRKQAGHWQQQYSLKTQKDWICHSGHQLNQQWEMLLHSLHIFSIYLPVGSTSKVTPEQKLLQCSQVGFAVQPNLCRWESSGSWDLGLGQNARIQDALLPCSANPQLAKSKLLCSVWE